MRRKPGSSSGAISLLWWRCWTTGSTSRTRAKSVYYGISPFLHADKINEPVLLIHGEKDNNSGTFPMQSRRMYQAIKGNGGDVRLVMLPEESHGYRARETVLDALYQQFEWFERPRRNAQRRANENTGKAELCLWHPTVSQG